MFSGLCSGSAGVAELAGQPAFCFDGGRLTGVRELDAVLLLVSEHDSGELDGRDVQARACALVRARSMVMPHSTASLPWGVATASARRSLKQLSQTST